jgi:hypothetical protein
MKLTESGERAVTVTSAFAMFDGSGDSTQAPFYNCKPQIQALASSWSARLESLGGFPGNIFG